MLILYSSSMYMFGDKPLSLQAVTSSLMMMAAMKVTVSFALRTAL
jgi:hypothetical protein